MPALLKRVRALFIILILLSCTGDGIKTYAYHLATPFLPALHIFSSDPDNKSSLRIDHQLQLPEGIITPAPSYQFGFTESLCLFILTLFLSWITIQLREIRPLFTYAYIVNLFVTLILINAP